MKALLIPLAFVLVLAIAAATAVVVGAAPTALLAGIVGVLCVLAMFGGTLRQDVRFAAVFGPAMVLVVAGPRLLLPIWAPGAIAAVVVTVFLAGLLPLLGRRYGPVTLAVGLGAVFGYAYPFLGRASALQITAAPVVGVVIALIIRLCAGAADPDAPLRTVLADLYIDKASVGAAFRMTAANAPRKWLSDVLVAGIRYRAAEAAIRLQPALQTANQGESTRKGIDFMVARAGAVSELVRRRSPGRGSLHATPIRPDSWSAFMSNELDAATVAATARSTSPQGVLPSLQHSRSSRGTGSRLNWRSPQLRHAVRSALAMLAVLLVAAAVPGDPLVVTLLAVTLGISQPLWRDTVSKTRQRLIGVLAGVVLLAVIVWLLPSGWLFGIGIASLIIGLIFISSRPVVYYAASVLLGIGTKSSRPGFDPVEMLIEYPVLILVAATIGVTFGLIAVPWLRPDSTAMQFWKAADATRTFMLAATRWPPAPAARPSTLPTDYTRAVTLTNALEQSAPGDANAQRAADGLSGLVAISSLTVIGARDEQLTRSLADAVEELTDVETLVADSTRTSHERDFKSEAVFTCLALVHDAARAYLNQRPGRETHPIR
ncbi:FUSC family protein [Amnibacterium sp.]|uniref:FUSC family protein n=1 Tax=Amnibacterium sp. TaxID=1872496 RepID=UPI00261C54C3|nr:FUSC family protein [Amnibacterium sp.]MCU1472020.1 hypothetical protein [Amnibacterium sp.]